MYRNVRCFGCPVASVIYGVEPKFIHITIFRRKYVKTTILLLSLFAGLLADDAARCESTYESCIEKCYELSDPSGCLEQCDAAYEKCYEALEPKDDAAEEER